VEWGGWEKTYPRCGFATFLTFLFFICYLTDAWVVCVGRMLVVLEVEKAGPDYDKILDILFLSVGLLNPSGMYGQISLSRHCTEICLVKKKCLVILCEISHCTKRIYFVQ
jgi:hypothetical protein